METNNFRPFFKIVSPDEKSFVWVKRPDGKHRSYMVFNFGEYKTQFADRLDKLAYMHVEEVKLIDEKDKGICSILFSFEDHHIDNYRLLLEDIPAIMDCVLNNTVDHD